MKKVRLCIAAVLLLALLAAAVPGGAEAGNVTATIDGAPIVGARLIGATTYLPLRAVCEGAGYKVGWQNASGTATVRGHDLDMSVARGSSYLVANGRYIYLGGGSARVIAGSMYVPARPLAKALGWQVEWLHPQRTARLTSGSGAIASGESFYKSDDVLWLARIISAESRGEPLVGQIAVGAVILNRVKSAEFPNSIYGVIFDNNWGVQFEPTTNGEIWKEPTPESFIAAKLALDGANPVGECLYFLNPAIATSGWIVENRQFHSAIGGHSFYL